jgi:hypothetical protein
MWVIGSAKQPRCFQNINIENTGIKWRSNKKAWMTTAIMREWMGWFWSYIHEKKPGKKVLLLLDNHSAHVKAIEELQNENSIILHDIEVIFLPANTTSRYQPCDQGIINTIKVYYRRHWTRYLLQEFEEGRNGRETMNVFKAIKWIVQVWLHDLKNTTILNCFHKSTVQQTVFTQQTFDDVDSGANILYINAVATLQANIDDLQQAQIVQQAMDITTFINPIEECAEVDVGDLDQDVLNEFTHGADFESDEEVEEQPIVKIHEALEAAKLIELWHLQRKDTTGDNSTINAIQKQIIQLEVAQQIERQKGRQGKLDSWLKKQ